MCPIQDFLMSFVGLGSQLRCGPDLVLCGKQSLKQQEKEVSGSYMKIQSWLLQLVALHAWLLSFCFGHLWMCLGSYLGTRLVPR